MKRLSKDDIIYIYESLEWANQQAQEIRGMYIGNPDPDPLQQFDKKLLKCETSLHILKTVINS